ncbi:MAG: Hsp20/alpha crystallin family protein [Patescibacteria group bacterium]
MIDLVPGTFWRFPRLSNMLDFDEDEDWGMVASWPNGLSLSEDEKNIFVEAAVPGLDPDDIEVTYDKGILWIKGQAAQEEENKKKKYYRKSMQSYSYRVAVPGDIDVNVEPEVTSKNGVVKVKFAKSPKSQPKKLTVKSK